VRERKRERGRKLPRVTERKTRIERERIKKQQKFVNKKRSKNTANNKFSRQELLTTSANKTCLLSKNIFIFVAKTKKIF